jgi:glycosyltransferase involved in cell wall biosynthesis
MNELPQVLVVIPTKDRLAQLSECLLDLTNQDYPREYWKIVVVNDGGADPSSVLPNTNQNSVPINLLSIPHCGPSAARNYGARSNSSDLIAFLDDDCRPEPTWLSEMVRGIWQTPWVACAGQTLNLFPSNPNARAFQFYYEFLRSYNRFLNGDLYLLMSNNAIYRQDIFRTYGGFCEQFKRPGAEDLELSHRLCALGYRQGYISTAVIQHAHCQHMFDFLRQQFRYGQGYQTMVSVLKTTGIPIRPALPRRRQFYIALVFAMIHNGVGFYESLLVLMGILAYHLGMHTKPAQETTTTFKKAVTS